MNSKLWLTVSTLCALWITIHCQIKCDIITETNDTLPDVLSSGDFRITVEINTSDRKDTAHVTEYYSSSQNKGRYDVFYRGKKSRVLYFNSTQELFRIQNDVCSTFNQSGQNDPWAFNVLSSAKRSRAAGQEVMPPSDLLRKYRLSSLAGAPLYLLPNNVSVRGISTNAWQQCDSNTKFEIFFTDPITDPLLGLRNAIVPVRAIQTMSTSKGNVTTYIEFVGFETLKEKPIPIFSIPVSVGCKRLDPEMKSMPSYEGKDVYFEAEVVYRPALTKSNYSYVTFLTMAVHHSSQHVAVQMTPWKNNKNVELSMPGDNIMKIYDLKNKYVYVVDNSLDTCNISKMNGDSPLMVLPDGQKVNLLDPDIFINDQAVTDYHYLGTTMERGVYSTVFEKTVTDDDQVGQYMATRYFTADVVTINNDFSEKKIPLKTVYLDVLSTKSDEQFAGKVEVNYFAFHNRLLNRQEKFDVSLCFQDNAQFQWFQLVFPLNGLTRSYELLPKIAYIESNFFDLLNDPIAESPLRFPVIKVDVDSDNIYVTGKILDRPSALLKFNETANTGVDVTQSERQGMLTLEKCARGCSQSPTCTKFSYCGAMCDFGKESTPVTVKPGCTLYQDANVKDSLPTINQLSKRMAELAGQHKDSDDPFTTLTLSLDIKGGKTDFTATKFKEISGFGLGKMTDAKEVPDILPYDQMSVFRYGSKFNPEDADESGRNLLARSFASCLKDCTANPNCQAMSYCAVSQQCFLSTKHPDELDQKHITEDTQCIIYGRNYLDYFERYPGVMLARSYFRKEKLTIEACAKACYQDKDNCRSFDSCPEGLDIVCLMHKVHLVGQDETPVTTTEYCGHYSRKYLLDFSTQWHQELTSTSDLTLSDLSAEVCARTCTETKDCKGFNYCIDYSDQNATGKCTLHKTNPGTRVSATCSAYIKK